MAWCLNCLNNWRAWIRPLVISVYFLILLVVLPLCVWELHHSDTDPVTKAKTEQWFIGGVFVFMALPISFWGILQHLVHYTKPYLQRHIVRILWMVPIYSLNAWLALKFPNSSIYLDVLRECYEAYVIYNFMVYLLNFLNSELDIEQTLELKDQVKHLFPVCCFPPWKMGHVFIERCKHGVLQYTVVRPIMTVIALVSELAGKYEEGKFKIKNSWTYIVVINNVSQIFAVYCLVLFYKATREQLEPIKPIPKFFCVKAVVFASFWQSVFISIIAITRGLPEPFTASSLQDFLICIEMFLAAVGHYFSFSHKPYIATTAQNVNCCDAFLAMWDVRDVKDDFVEHVKVVGKTMRKTVIRDKRVLVDEPTEQSHLLDASPESPSMSNYRSNGVKFPTFQSRSKCLSVAQSLQGALQGRRTPGEASESEEEEVVCEELQNQILQH